MNNHEEKINKIANNIVGKIIVALPKLTSYKGVNIYLNGNDHRPPHFVAMCPNKEREKADFCINNGNDQKYPDGSLLKITSGFPKNKLEDVKEWFEPNNREERINKIIEYFIERGEPTWFNITEIFTKDELKKYNLKKNNIISSKKIISFNKIDLSKPWSKENDYDEITEIKKVIANDDYTLTVFFKDKSKKIYDVKDKIFDKNNRDYKWFSKLQDLNEFKKVKECGWSVRWNDDIDISSYELYVNGK